jgi:predicted permease
MPLIELVGIFFLIILIIQILKLRGVFNDTHQPVFDRLVTELALPVIIFSSLATTTIRAEFLKPSLIIFGAVLACAILAYGACRVFRVSRKTTGTVVMVSAFGSTVTLATPVIHYLYGSAGEAMSIALFTGSVGVALPFFTLGVLIAVWFGRDEKEPAKSIITTVWEFLFTPIFIAFILGLCFTLLFSTMVIPGGSIFADIFIGFFAVLKSAADLLVWIALGLLLRPLRYREILPVISVVVLLKLFLLPVLALSAAYAAGLDVLTQQVLVIEAAMPSGAIASVLASRYGCDGPLAANLVIITYLISLGTLSFVVLAIV